jgi:hypothetical protein
MLQEIELSEKFRKQNDSTPLIFPHITIDGKADFQYIY